MVLRSLEKQTLSQGDFEVLIVNNNSLDNTEEIVQNYLKKTSLRIQYMIEYNQGVSYARNRGVGEAKGDIIVFLDDDETVEPDFLFNIKTFFMRFPEVGITAGPVIPVFETSKPKWLSKFIERAITGEYNQGDVIKKLSSRNFPGTGHACFRKKLFDKYGNFNIYLGRKGNSLMGAEDKDFVLRLMEGNEICYYLPGAKIYHHISDTKLTEAFFDSLSYAIGKSERVRTLNGGKRRYYRRLFDESKKWITSFIFCVFFYLTLQPDKGNKIIQFRKILQKDYSASKSGFSSHTFMHKIFTPVFSKRNIQLQLVVITGSGPNCTY